MRTPTRAKVQLLPAGAGGLLTGLRTWTLPLLVLLLAAVTLNLTLHPHWLDLVWSVRGLAEPTWSPAMTRLRFALDAGTLGLGALSAALTLRYGVGRERLALAALLLVLGLLSSWLLLPWLGAASGPLLWTSLAALGGLCVLGVRWRIPAARLWGELALLGCLLLCLLGQLPSDLSGRPVALLGSLRLAVWWNELWRPLLRDLGFTLYLVGAALAWLEGRPGTLRSGLARAAVLSGLAGFTALVYVGIVGGVGTLVGAENSLWLGTLAAALVAVGFGGARSALVRGVNRLLYGARDDPFLMTRRLGLALAGTRDPRARLDAALTLMVSDLRLPGAALHLLGGEVLTHGDLGTAAPLCADPITPAVSVWPLVVGGERLGTLLVARRSARETLSAADRRLLGALADQLADAARAWQLEDALRTSRERLVRAGEEERRRLRRDLHDGLGPALSGLGLKLEAARRLLARAPEQADAHLSALEGEVRESVSEVRRLVHDLRPPKLDDLGLQGALEELLAGVQTLGLAARCEVTSELTRGELSGGGPPLSAAAEVAVYRIAQEAVTNVVKHAQARLVVLRLKTAAGRLMLEIEDDGVGLPQVRVPGVGSRSMRERAEALSGTLEWIRRERGGTLVRATLPL